jgi:hypothetical protein
MRSTALATILLAAACSKDWRPLDPSMLARQPAHSIGVVGTKPFSGFRAGTVVRNVTGFVGMAVTSVSGEQIIKENHIADPAVAIGSRLVVALAGKYGLEARTPKQISPPSEQRVRWDTDLYLQVRTENWGVTYFPGDWAHYRVFYEASLELHDSRGQRVIASGQCQAPLTEDPTGAPTWDELLARRALFVRDRLDEAATFCAQKLSRELFAIRLPDDIPPPPVVPVDPKVKYAPCHLEDTPAWKAADPAGKHKLLEECWNKRAAQEPATAPAP